MLVRYRVQNLSHTYTETFPLNTPLQNEPCYLLVNIDVDRVLHTLHVANSRKFDQRVPSAKKQSTRSHETQSTILYFIIIASQRTRFPRAYSPMTNIVD